MKYNNHSEFRSKAILAVKRVVAERLSEFRSWRGIDLAPAFERHLISIVRNNREYYQKYLEEDTSLFFQRLNEEELKQGPV